MFELENSYKKKFYQKLKDADFADEAKLFKKYIWNENFINYFNIRNNLLKMKIEFEKKKQNLTNSNFKDNSQDSNKESDLSIKPSSNKNIDTEIEIISRYTKLDINEKIQSKDISSNNSFNYINILEHNKDSLEIDDDFLISLYEKVNYD